MDIRPHRVSDKVFGASIDCTVYIQCTVHVRYDLHRFPPTDHFRVHRIYPQSNPYAKATKGKFYKFIKFT